MIYGAGIALQIRSWGLTPIRGARAIFILDIARLLTYHFFMYIASIRTTFSAAHRIEGYEGNCAQPHGHNYRVEVHVAAQGVNETGLSVDFRKLKQMAHAVVAQLDHRMLNDLPFFAEHNPTAENIARYLFDELKGKLPDHLSLHCVRIWETDDYMVEYHD